MEGKYSIDRSAITLERGTYSNSTFTPSDTGLNLRLTVHITLIAGQHLTGYPRVRVVSHAYSGAGNLNWSEIADSTYQYKNWVITITGNVNDGWDAVIIYTTSNAYKAESTYAFDIKVYGYTRTNPEKPAIDLTCDTYTYRLSTFTPVVRFHEWGSGLGVGIALRDKFDIKAVTINPKWKLITHLGQYPFLAQELYDAVFPVGSVLQYWSTVAYNGAESYANSLRVDYSSEVAYHSTAVILYAQWTADKSPIATITCDNGTKRYLYNITRTK